MKYIQLLIITLLLISSTAISQSTKSTETSFEEISKNLNKQTPLTIPFIKKWIPKFLGDFELSYSSVGEKLEDTNITSNATIHYKKGDKTIEISLVDCAQNPKAIEMSLFAFAMDKQLGENTYVKKPFNYIYQHKIDEGFTQVLIEKEYRFILDISGINMQPEELLNYLEKLPLNELK